MSELAINTRAGRAAVEQQHQIEAWLSDCYPNTYTVSTPSTAPAPYDGFLCKWGEVVAVYEIKTRSTSIEQLNRMPIHPGCVILSYSKITEGQAISRQLNVPFLFVAYLEVDRKLAIWQITESNGDLCHLWQSSHTETQATINRGRATRQNAYLPLDKARIFQINVNRYL